MDPESSALHRNCLTYGDCDNVHEIVEQSFRPGPPQGKYCGLTINDNLITSLGNRFAEDLFLDKESRDTQRFPPEIRRQARRELLYLHDASDLRDLRDLQISPDNRLERLRGDMRDFHSIRINDQWRVVFRGKAVTRRMYACSTTIRGSAG